MREEQETNLAGKGRSMSLRSKGATVALLLAALASLWFAAAANPTGAQDSVVYTAADLTSYLEKWERRDGEAGTVISDYFCAFATANPRLFLSTMAEHPQLFSEWVESLPSLSFVNFGGCMDRECMRLTVLGSVERAEPEPGTSTLQSRLVQVLRTATVKEIE